MSESTVSKERNVNQDNEKNDIAMKTPSIVSRRKNGKLPSAASA
jgi:hypothetical protein